MTTIKVQKNGNRTAVEIKGHAGFQRNKNGNDLVCSAASMIASTLAQHAQKLHAAGLIERFNEFKYEAERVSVDFIVAEGEDAKTRANEMVEVIVTGYELLAERYPKNVQMQLDY